MNNALSLRGKLALSTAIVGVLVGYGRRAYAACASTGGSSYLCSGTNSTPQTVNANNASVSTAIDFIVNTSTGDALYITGQGALSFTDNDSSQITSTAASSTGLHLYSSGDSGSTAASIKITTGANSSISGLQYGIDAVIKNSTHGGVSSITTGAGSNVSGRIGINVSSKNRPGENTLSITTGANSAVFGEDAGINVYFTSRGNSTLSITTGAGSSVSGKAGISAFSVSNNASTLLITANGTITGTGTGTGTGNLYVGIGAVLGGNNDSLLSITVNKDGLVQGQ